LKNILSLTRVQLKKNICSRSPSSCCAPLRLAVVVGDRRLEKTAATVARRRRGAALIQSPRSQDRRVEKSATTLPRRLRAAVVPPRPGWTPQLLASSTAGSNNTTSSSTRSWPQPLPHLLRCNTGVALLIGGIEAAYNLIKLEIFLIPDLFFSSGPTISSSVEFRLFCSVQFR
jgi:hypothetical protein